MKGQQSKGETRIITAGAVRKEIFGSGCAKLTMSLVNVMLKFQMLVSEIHQYFLLKNFFNKKYQCLWFKL